MEVEEVQKKAHASSQKRLVFASESVCHNFTRSGRFFPYILPLLPARSLQFSCRAVGTEQKEHEMGVAVKKHTPHRDQVPTPGDSRNRRRGKKKRAITLPHGRTLRLHFSLNRAWTLLELWNVDGTLSFPSGFCSTHVYERMCVCVWFCYPYRD